MDKFKRLSIERYVSIAANIATVIAIFIGVLSINNSSKIATTIHLHQAYAEALRAYAQSALDTLSESRVLCPKALIDIRLDVNEKVAALYLWSDEERIRDHYHSLTKEFDRIASLGAKLPHYRPQRCIGSGIARTMISASRSQDGEDFIARYLGDMGISYTSPNPPFDFRKGELTTPHWLNPDLRDEAIRSIEKVKAGKENDG